MSSTNHSLAAKLCEPSCLNNSLTTVVLFCDNFSIAINRACLSVSAKILSSKGAHLCVKESLLCEVGVVRLDVLANLISCCSVLLEVTC